MKSVYRWLKRSEGKERLPARILHVGKLSLQPLKTLNLQQDPAQTYAACPFLFNKNN